MHADAVQIDKGKAFEIDLRYGAAAVRVAQLGILTRDTLSFIRFLVDQGLIEISAQALDDVPVKVESRKVGLTDIYSAPSGVENPGPAGRALSDDWRSALPVTGDGQWILRIPSGRND